MKPLIISFSSHGRENYNKAMLGLIASCKPIWDGDYMMYSSDGYIDQYLDVQIEMGAGLYPQPEAWHCYNNTEVPYQFKLAMFQRAIEAGYTKVIWCDSTIRMLKHPQILLDIASKQGVVTFHNIGHNLAPYCSDAALQKLGIDLSDSNLNSFPSIMACCIIFDFENPTGKEVFHEWVKHSHDGVSFQNGYGSARKDFVAHRHDQAILSYLVYKRGIPMQPYGELVYPPHHETKEYGDNIYFLNKGV